MKYQAAAIAIVALVTPTWAKEMAVDPVRKAELFDSGVRHEQIMELKKVCELQRILQVSNHACVLRDNSKSGMS